MITELRKGFLKWVIISGETSQTTKKQKVAVSEDLNAPIADSLVDIQETRNT